MRRTALFIFSALLLGFLHAEENPAIAQGADPDVVDQRDTEALRDWLDTQRQITIKELSGKLSISGEVRAEMQSTSEKVDGSQKRGSKGSGKKKTPRHL